MNTTPEQDAVEYKTFIQDTGDSAGDVDGEATVGQNGTMLHFGSKGRT